MSSSGTENISVTSAIQTALAASAEGADPTAATPAAEQIDLALLAQKVVRLLKQELKLEQERQGQPRRF